MDTLFIPWLEPIDIPADHILPNFLPPLLWALARRTSWAVIRSQLFTVVSLSVLLVLATIAAVAGTTYLLLPSMGIVAAVVIGAALAPPDPVAVVDFLKSVIIAVMVGVAFGFGAAMLSNWMESTTARTALSWTVPFAVFLVAEEMHASGVIVTVIAAVEMNSRLKVGAEDRLSGGAFWETIEMMFTGVAFGLIGLNVRDAIETADVNWRPWR